MEHDDVKSFIKERVCKMCEILKLLVLSFSFSNNLIFVNM